MRRAGTSKLMPEGAAGRPGGETSRQVRVRIIQTAYRSAGLPPRAAYLRRASAAGKGQDGPVQGCLAERLARTRLRRGGALCTKVCEVGRRDFEVVPCADRPPAQGCLVSWSSSASEHGRG